MQCPRWTSATWCRHSITVKMRSESFLLDRNTEGDEGEKWQRCWCCSLVLTQLGSSTKDYHYLVPFPSHCLSCYVVPVSVLLLNISATFCHTTNPKVFQRKDCSKHHSSQLQAQPIPTSSTGWQSRKVNLKPRHRFFSGLNFYSWLKPLQLWTLKMYLLQIK